MKSGEGGTRAKPERIFIFTTLLAALLLTGCATTEPARQGEPVLTTSPSGGGGESGVVIVKESGGEQAMKEESGARRSVTREEVSLITEDKVRLAATYYEASGEEAVILLHQLNKDRRSWEEFARQLQQRGYAVLAIDFRGHGESEGDWRRFGKEEFRAMLKDVMAGAAFLHEMGRVVSGVVGASIGANTAFRYSSLEKVPAVLLSPGLNYRGIDINDVTSTAPTLVIAAEGDEYSARSARELDENNLFGEHQLLIVPGSEHGTGLLGTRAIEEAITTFLERSRGE